MMQGVCRMQDATLNGAVRFAFVLRKMGYRIRIRSDGDCWRGDGS